MTDRCTQYALDVVAGVIIAGEYVRLACQRHLDDLEKAKAAPYKYYFDVEKSEEIINFAEELTIAEGDEQENVTAYPFQCFILGSLNGWRTKEKGHRRFRTSYVQLGRQNGKSFINGILACYYGNFDGYKYGKIFCTATKQDQANIVFDEIVKFINSDEDLSEWFKVHEHNHTIDCLCTHSEIKALSGDTKSLDGHRAYLGIVDEYHAHKTNQMWIAKKTKATRNAMILKVADEMTKGKEVVISTIDSLKDVFNVGLDPAITTGAMVIANQNGYNYLDKLKDKDGKYILQPNPTQPTQMMLFGKYPIVKVSNRTVKSEPVYSPAFTISGSKLAIDGTTTAIDASATSDVTAWKVVKGKYVVTCKGQEQETTVDAKVSAYKHPVYMGDLKEAITLFDRNVITIDMNDKAAGLWEKDMTGIKVRDRFDVQPVDDGAIIKGNITEVVQG